MTAEPGNRHTHDLASAVQTPTALEVAMSPTVTHPDAHTDGDVDRIDCDLSVAQVAVGLARRAYARCPSGENAGLLDDAVAAVDRLLDLRLAASG